MGNEQTFFENIGKLSDIIIGSREAVNYKRVLKQKVKVDNRTNCEKCGLGLTCKSPCIRPFGYKDAQLFFIGEAPGAIEDQHGRPFIGASGKLLRRALNKFGLLRKSIFSNIIKCRPPGNRTPNKKEISLCGDQFLWQEIDRAKPKLIVLLGATASYYFLPDISFDKARYEIHKINGYNFMVTTDPEYICRNPEAMLTYDVDFGKINFFLNKNNDKFEYRCLKDLGEIKQYFKYLSTQKEFSFDVETIGLSPYLDSGGMVCASFYDGKELPTVVYWKDILQVMQSFKDLLVSPAKMTADNGKYDVLHSWARGNVRCSNFDFDPMVAEYLLDEHKKYTSLAKLSWVYLPDCIGWKSMVKDYITDMSKCPEKLLIEYSAKDAYYTFNLKKPLENLLKAEKLETLMPFMCRTLTSLAYLEHRGVKIDENYLNQSISAIEKEIEILKTQFLTFTVEHGYTNFNMNSSVQLKDLFFNKLKFPILKYIKNTKVKTPALDQDVLPLYEKKHKIVGILGEYRRYSKVLSTYLLALKKHLNKDSFIHTQFFVTHTKSGRTTSSDPINLQNMPRQHENEKWSGINPYATVKRCFVSRFKSGKIVEGDYGQLELRVLAMISKDKNLIDIFKTGKDIHGEVAKQFAKHGKPTEEDRSKAKAVNFGIVYGAGPKTIAKNLNCSYDIAEIYIEKWLNRFPEARLWITSIKQFLYDNGYTRGLTGRKRRILKVYSDNEYKRAAAYREGVNSPIQGMASDILLYALNTITDSFLDENLQSFPIIPVHDSLAFDVHPDEYEYVLPKIKIIMESVDLPFINVPLKVEFKVGNNWGDVKKI